MTTAKLGVLVCLTATLSAWSTSPFASDSNISELEGISVQSLHSILGKPTNTLSLPDGVQRDVFVFSERKAKRSSFRDIQDDTRLYPTNPKKQALVGHNNTPLVKFKTVTCTVEAEYGVDESVESVSAMPVDCLKLKQI